MQIEKKKRRAMLCDYLFCRKVCALNTTEGNNGNQ